MARQGDGHPAFRARLLHEALDMQGALTAVTRSRLPFVAAVHGACVGTGLELAAVCDLRVASADAYFSLREVRIGVVADLGSLQRLPRLIGVGATRDLASTGRDVPAAEAGSLGLGNRVLGSVDELWAHAAEVASLIATNPPHVVAGIKAVCEQTQDLPVDAGLRYAAAWNATFLPSPELTGLMAGVLRGPTARTG